MSKDTEKQVGESIEKAIDMAMRLSHNMSIDVVIGVLEAGFALGIDKKEIIEGIKMMKYSDKK